MKRFFVGIALIVAIFGMTSCTGFGGGDQSCTCSYKTDSDSTWSEKLTDSWSMLDVKNCEDLGNWYSIDDTHQAYCN